MWAGHKIRVCVGVARPFLKIVQTITRNRKCIYSYIFVVARSTQKTPAEKFFLSWRACELGFPSTLLYHDSRGLMEWNTTYG